MPQLDLTSYISQLFWVIFLFTYLFLYIHTNVIVVIVQILKTRHFKKKIDFNRLEENIFFLKKELNKLEINCSFVSNVLEFSNFSNLILLNILYRDVKINIHSFNFFFKSILNSLIIK